MFKIRAQH